MSTNPENVVKIGPVYSEIIISQEGTLKIKKEKRNISKTYSRRGRQAE